MAWKFTVTPVLLRWHKPEIIDRTVVLFDLYPDVLHTGHLKLDINVVFSPIAIRSGNLRRADYYVASTGVRVEVEARNGSIQNYSPEVRLAANYKISHGRTQNTGLKLAPSLEWEGGGKETKLSGLEVSYQAGDQSTLETSYTGSECLLTPTLYGSRIRWSLALPKGEMVIRDFLEGNLFLFAECKWQSRPREGSVSVRPSDIRFFSPDRKQLVGFLGSLKMQATLWRRGIKILNPDGFQAVFSLEGE